MAHRIGGRGLPVVRRVVDPSGKARTHVNPRYHRVLLAALALTSAHCVSATPVTPAPISPDQAPKLQAALMGTCHVTGTQKPGGEIDEAKGIYWTFADGCKGQQRLEVIGTILSDFNYRLEGRNIVTDGTFKTIRVDDYSDKTLKLFVYELSQYYYCTKV